MSFYLINPFKALNSRRLRKALEDYRRNPGLEKITRIVRLSLKGGDLKQAFQYADSGFQKFSSSKELRDLRQLSLKKLAQSQCRSLEKEVARSPRPEAIAKVIELRRSLGNFRECEKLSSQWKDRFPNSWVLQFAIGKYLFHRCFTEDDPTLSSNCLKQFEKASNLNPTNYKTLLYFATHLFQTGSLREALQTAEELLESYPGDSRARALRQRIYSNLTSQPKDELRAPLVDIQPEEQRRGVDDEIFAQLQKSPSVYAVLLVKGVDDSSITTHAYFAEECGYRFEKGEAVLSDLIRSLRLSSHRMGIGELKTCLIRGGSWQIFFRNHPMRSFLIWADKNFQEETFEKAMNRIAPEGAMV